MAIRFRPKQWAAKNLSIDTGRGSGSGTRQSGQDRSDERAFDPADSIGAQTRMPEHVAAILHRACSDCHTDRTRWPRYGKVAPFQWLISADVYGARAHLNLSSWGRYKPEERNERLIGMCEMV